jgi:DNA-binding CsgD family transcriptional regulator
MKQDLGEALHQLYKLTTAEARVAFAIASGQTPLEIAEAAATSAGTVRTQLKSIFAKMGISRQSHLVAVLSEISRIVPGHS